MYCSALSPTPAPNRSLNSKISLWAATKAKEETTLPEPLPLTRDKSSRKLSIRLRPTRARAKSSPTKDLSPVSDRYCALNSEIVSESESSKPSRFHETPEETSPKTAQETLSAFRPTSSWRAKIAPAQETIICSEELLATPEAKDWKLETKTPSWARKPSSSTPAKRLDKLSVWATDEEGVRVAPSSRPSNWDEVSNEGSRPCSRSTDKTRE